MLVYLTLLLTGLVAGMLGSIVGLGGGVIMLPVTQLVLKFDPAISVGTTLFAIIFTSLSSAWGHFKAGNVRLASGAYIGGGGIIGTFLGSYIFKEYLADSVDLLLFFLGCLFLFMSFRMGRDAYREWQARKGIVVAREVKAPLTEHSVIGLVMVGIATGVMAAILGVGGGFLMVPAMIILFGAQPKLAVGTTFLAMLPIALSGGFLKLYQGFVQLDAGILMGLGTAVGAQLGVFLTRYLSPLVMRIVFSAMFLVIGGNYVSRLLL